MFDCTENNLPDKLIMFRFFYGITVYFIDGVFAYICLEQVFVKLFPVLLVFSYEHLTSFAKSQLRIQELFF